MLIYPPLFILAAEALAKWITRNTASRYAVAAFVCVISLTGIFCSLQTRQLGYRSNDVLLLKKIDAAAKASGYRICGFEGPNGRAWRGAMEIIDANELGCRGTRAGEIVADREGTPSIRIVAQPSQILAVDQRISKQDDDIP